MISVWFLSVAMSNAVKPLCDGKGVGLKWRRPHVAGGEGGGCGRRGEAARCLRRDPPHTHTPTPPPHPYPTTLPYLRHRSHGP